MRLEGSYLIYKIIIAPLWLVLMTIAAADAHAAQIQLDTAQAQIEIASKEAALAAEARELDTIHRHLQRAVNCLVGPIGEGFDRRAGHPCLGQGRGAMQDLEGSLGILKLVDQALNLAKLGLRIEALGPARDVAEAARKILVTAHQELTEK
jgi:hypothetical protein